MREWIVGPTEEGQRFDKYLLRKLPAAGSSFLYKMLRKKNITLNDKKAEGDARICAGDRVKLYLSDETIGKFSGSKEDTLSSFLKAYDDLQPLLIRKLGHDPVLYENGDFLIMEKPFGVLSQKAKDSDISMNEWLIGYLAANHKISAETFSQYHPSVCNRLDRNTGGLLIGAVTLRGARQITGQLRERSLHKFYHMIVQGTVTEDGELEGYLVKDEKENRTSFYKPDTGPMQLPVGAVYSRTTYRVLRTGTDITGTPVSLLEAELITGKTHQLRAHLAFLGHPIAGDPKYGDSGWNSLLLQKAGVRHQLLYCVRVEIPGLSAGGRDNVTVSCSEPSVFKKIL